MRDFLLSNASILAFAITLGIGPFGGSGGGDVAPTYTATGTININDDVADGTTIATVNPTNSPSPASLNSVNINGGSSDFEVEASGASVLIKVKTGANLPALVGTPPTIQIDWTHDGGSGSFERTIDVSAAGATFATLTLLNTSGSEQATNFVTRMFGHPFKQGDVPSGQYPKFALADTTNVPYSMFNPVYWPDGSLMFAGFVLRVPSSIAGSSSITLDISSWATAPGSNSRGSADISGQDLKIEMVGIRNLTGTWTSAVNTGISDGDIEEYAGEGAVGKLYRVYQEFRDGSSNHAHLYAFHYVLVLENAAGGLYGLRYLGRTINGYSDATSTGFNTRVVEAPLLKNGGATIRTISPEKTPATFTRSGNELVLASTANLKNGMSFTVSSDGTLPPGLSAGTGYYVFLKSGTNITVHTNLFDTEEGQGGPNPVALSGAGSGTHTLTPRVTIPYYAGFTTAGTDAEWDFVQAGGSGAECTVHIQFSKSYWRETKVIPPVDTAVTPASVTAVDHYVNGWKDFGTDFDAPGERIELGLYGARQFQHFLLQTAAARKSVLTHANMAAVISGAVRDSTNLMPMNIMSGSYTGLIASDINKRYRTGVGGAALSGITGPSEWGYCAARAPDYAHMPQFHQYAYQITGQPEFLDLIHEMAVFGELTLWVPDRNFSTYRGIVMRDGQERVSAWILGYLAAAAGLTPTSFYGSQMKQYALDILAENFDYLLAQVSGMPSFSQTAGVFPFVNRTTSPWATSYLFMAICQSYAYTQDPDALEVIERQMTFFNGVRTNQGLFWIAGYRMGVQNGAGTGYAEAWGDIVHAPSDLGTTGVGGGGSISASADTVTIGTYGSQFNALVNDDRFGITDFSGGVDKYRSFHVVNRSGNTFQLSASQGGSAIDFTGNESSLSAQNWLMNNAQDNSKFTQGVFATAYAIMARATIHYAEHLGATMPSGLRSAVDTAVTGYGFSFNGDEQPKYALAA